MCCPQTLQEEYELHQGFILPSLELSHDLAWVEVLMLWIKPRTVRFQAVKESHQGLLGNLFVLAA